MIPFQIINSNRAKINLSSNNQGRFGSLLAQLHYPLVFFGLALITIEGSSGASGASGNRRRVRAVQVIGDDIASTKIRAIHQRIFADGGAAGPSVDTSVDRHAGA